MELSSGAEKKLKQAFESPKCQTKAVELFSNMTEEKMTHAEILAVGLMITETVRKVLEGNDNEKSIR